MVGGGFQGNDAINEVIQLLSDMKVTRSKLGYSLFYTIHVSLGAKRVDSAMELNESIKLL